MKGAGGMIVAKRMYGEMCMDMAMPMSMALRAHSQSAQTTRKRKGSR